MTHELISAGFGGQGVLAIGKLIAQAAVAQGMNATWLPSYGAEVRGGAANCCCVLSDEEIISPMVLNPTELILMNDTACKKFLPTAAPGALVLINSSIVTERQEGFVLVPCGEIAQALGSARSANMVMVGAYAAATGYIREETLRELINKVFSGKKAALAAQNLEALRLGAECVR